MAAQSSSKGQAWFCTTGLPSDIVVEVDDMTFHLHKFPLMSKSEKLNDLISEQEAKTNTEFIARRQSAASAPSEKGKKKEAEEVKAAEDDGDDAESEIEVNSLHITLPEFPGGSETFEVAAKFCYGVKIDLSAANAAPLRCAGEVLQMTEEYSEDNLISRTERFLTHSVFRNLKDSISALKSCENLMPMTEDLGIVQRCIDTISAKAALVDPSLFGWPVNESARAGDSNRSLLIAGGRDPKDKKPQTPPRSKPGGAEPWFEDLSVLCYDFFNRVLEAMKAREISPEVIEGCLLHYAKKCFPGISRSSRKLANSSASTSNASEADQKELLESIVHNLPTEKCSSSSRSMKILFGLLRTANILSASEHCKCVLERKIGAQLEQVTLDDLLIPSYSYLDETLYDVDCVERILGHFLESFSGRSGEGLTDNFEAGVARSPSIMLVGKLIDGYLSEIASDANLKPEKFSSLALSLPDQARLFDDGLYRAVDVYLKAHSWISELEREMICRVMDCQKLTLEACTHAAQNERLPLRAVVQVLFFEQLQLRHAIAGTLLAAEGAPLESVGRLSNSIHNDEEDDQRGRPIPQLPGAQVVVRENQVMRLDMDSMKTRLHELERECSTMKKVIERIDKDGPLEGKRKSSFTKKFGCKFKTQVCDSHQPTVVEGRRGRNSTSNARRSNK